MTDATQQQQEHSTPRPASSDSRHDGGSSRPGGGASRPQRSRPRGRYYYRRRKVCKFCADKIDAIDWKDAKLLSQFIPERGKILPRRISGTCAMHQRKLMRAIKRARIVALLPFAPE